MSDIADYWFKSSKFEIEPGEDEDINPGIYGRQLAVWLRDRLEEHGYSIELINEDWGRCLMCSRHSSRVCSSICSRVILITRTQLRKYLTQFFHFVGRDVVGQLGEGLGGFVAF